MGLASLATGAGWFAAALALSLLMTLGLRGQAARLGFVDVPTPRGAHHAPVPRLGGWGIALALAVCAVADRHRPPSLWLLAGALVFLTGWADDRWHLPPGVKMLGIAGAALLFLGGWGAPLALGLPGGVWTPAPWLARAGGALWLCTFTNFFNFMDGVNAMAGACATLYGLYFAALALASQASPAFALAYAGAAAGFLICNANGGVFMGDSGSLLLGFVAAAQVLAMPDAGAVSAALIAMSPLVYDPALTLLRRAWAGKPVWQAHREHLYQRLLPTMSHLRITGLYAALSLAMMALGWQYRRAALPGRLGVLAGMAALLGLLTLGVSRRRLRLQSSP